MYRTTALNTEIIKQLWQDNIISEEYAQPHHGGSVRESI